VEYSQSYIKASLRVLWLAYIVSGPRIECYCTGPTSAKMQGRMSSVVKEW